MSTITANQVKELRDKSGVGMMDCKKALQEANGNIEKAFELLRKSGIAKAQKKAGRDAKEGSIVSYIHPGAKLGVLLELNCETDFVANTDDFKDLANDICMHIAATAPISVKSEDVDSAIPFFLKTSNALSKSPLASIKAFLQSIIPTPERSLNSLTSCALIDILIITP